MKIRYAAICLVLFGVLGCPSVARADQEALPQSYAQTTANGKYVFVMRAPLGLLDGLVKNITLKLKTPHSQSGLYAKDNARVPLWTVDWYSSKVYVSSNGKNVVRMGPWPRSWEQKLSAEEGALKQLAVAFYENGTLLKGYAIKDIIKNPDALPRTVSHFEWAKDVTFDDGKSELRIATHDGQELVFDITSGDRIKKDST